MADSLNLNDALDPTPPNPHQGRSLQDYSIKTPPVGEAIVPLREAIPPAIYYTPWEMYWPAEGSAIIRGPRYNSYIHAGFRQHVATEQGWPADSDIIPASSDRLLYLEYDIDNNRFNPQIQQADTAAFPSDPRQRYYILGRAITDAESNVTWIQMQKSNIYDNFFARFPAKITNRSSGYEYEWEILQRDYESSYAPPITSIGIACEASRREDIADGTIVELIPYIDSSGDPKYLFFGGAGGGSSFWAELTSDSSPYSWKQKDPNAFTDASPAFTGASNAVEVNLRDGIPIGSIVRMFAHPDPQIDSVFRFEFHGAESFLGSPEDHTFTGEHQELPRPNVDWDRADQGSNRGLILTICTGVAYYEAGDETLYAYYQDFTFDANGHLNFVSLERREIIDVPEDC